MTRERIETFSVALDHMVRSVVPVRGRPYEHRCTRQAYEAVAHAAQEIGQAGFTLEDLQAATDLPSTQVAVALAFMKERGCVLTRYKRNYPACDYLFEDAMIEYWALAEKGPAD